METQKDKTALKYALIVAIAILGALNYQIFVFPNHFAPAGLNGIATMIQYKLNFNLGYMSLIINIPMLVAALFVLNRKYALRTLVYILVFSAANICFGRMDFTQIAFSAEDGGESILAAVAAGVFNGFFYSIALRSGGSTGGSDIVAAFVNKRRPDYDLVWIIFALNASVAFASFFVYGNDYKAVILCIVYSFVTSRMNETILKGAKSAIQFEVITTHADEIAQEIITKLNHSCTCFEAKGMYTGRDEKMLICVINKHQIVDFEDIIKKYDNTFTIISGVNNTIGVFQKNAVKRIL